MRAAELAKILLVRAVEENEPHATTSPEADAAASAGRDGGGEPGWLLRRAEHRLAHEFAGWRGLLGIAELPQVPRAFLALPFALGLASNWLGPSAQIHVLYNPIAVLVAWNLALFAALAFAPFVGRRLRARGARREADPSASAAPIVASERPRATRGMQGWLLRRLAPALLLRLRRDAEGAAVGAARVGRVARRFWSLWVEAAGALVVARVRRMLHLSAAALAVGAVAGMLVRGVFFEYAMVWRSTFVRDPETVAAALRVALGPAAWLTGRPLPDAGVAERMMSATGVPAATWIALWAITAALAVVLPRLALALASSLRRRVLARRVAPALEDPYFEALLAGVRRAEIERIEAEIGADVRAEIDRLIERVAAFVCTRLYDDELVPLLHAFRATGGSVARLEEQMAEACRAFEPALDAELEQARAAFEEGLRAAVLRTIGRSSYEAPAREVAFGASDLPVGELGGAVGREISNAVGTAVSAGVALVAATLAGGFGHHLGVALLVTLLHVTGPIAFVIGGIGGLAVASAGWWLGRDRVASGMRGVRLPRAVARLALRDAALAKLVASGREQCGEAVRAKLGAELAPLAPMLAEEIWSKLRRVLPGVGSAAGGTHP